MAFIKGTVTNDSLLHKCEIKTANELHAYYYVAFLWSSWSLPLLLSSAILPSLLEF